MFAMPKIALPIDSHNRHLAVEVARHEAGHYIVGRVHGFTVGSISVCLLDLHGGHSAQAEMTPTSYTPSIEAFIEWAEKRVQQLYAGVLAQALDEAGKIDFEKATEFAKNGGADDYKKAMVFIHLIRNMQLPVPDSRDELEAQLLAIHQPLWGSAAEVVEQESQLIIGLGCTLGNKVEFTSRLYTLTEEELEDMTELRVRFSVPKE
ncbi:hypothetical protein J2X57_002791 [Luteibacter sp. 1214]|uniref:hypothetical protein n=1 Tax=Luteibacter sp. 1214 TaxID=2817735 RepID=UPI0028661F06|nr:hypothetical protein [Luteibacter sp. 1214]MDR6643570.1 hypothetical protein [Luteibacter sp. 1214]